MKRATGILSGFRRVASPPHLRRVNTVYTGVGDMSISKKSWGREFILGRRQRIRVGPGFWVVTRESLCERAVSLKIYWRKTLMEGPSQKIFKGVDLPKRLVKMSALSALPPPLTTIRNETFFRVDGGWRCWLCLTDAQRHYTTLQFWQVTGSADGVYPGFFGRTLSESGFSG